MWGTFIRPLSDQMSEKNMFGDLTNESNKSPLIDNNGQYVPYHGNEFDEWLNKMMGKAKNSALSNELPDQLAKCRREAKAIDERKQSIMLQMRDIKAGRKGKNTI